MAKALRVLKYIAYFAARLKFISCAAQTVKEHTVLLNDIKHFI